VRTRFLWSAAVRAWRAAVIAIAFVAAACGGEDRCAKRPPPTPLDRATTGTITGTVKLDGTPPPMRTLSLQADPQCAAQHSGPVPAGDVLVKDGRVANAFVWIADGLGDRTFAVPETPVEIDQTGCLYRPRVAGVQVCQPIRFVNSDPTLHNVHGTPAHSAPWNFGMPVKGARRDVRVEASEMPVEVRCDVHPWMRAFLGVVDHPYFAVTGADGAFTLREVPPGDYVVASWHERFGKREAKLTVGAKEAKDVTFTYAAGGS
jgi:hypothetical protein